MKRPLIVVLLFLLPLSGFAAGAQVDPAVLLSKAMSSFRAAAETKNHTKAELLYRGALADLQELTRQDHIRNEPIYYDLGNVYERLGDAGRAILNYRRAALYDPFDPQLEHNLSFVRAQRKDRLPVMRPPLLLRVIFFWHYDLSVEAQMLLFSIAFAMIWVTLGLRIFLRARWLKWPALTAGIAASLLVFSLAWSQIGLGTHSTGVIVSSEVTARQGDALSYDPAFKTPLHSGTEFTVIGTRPEWYHIALSDGTDAWIPQSAAELVRPLSSR